ncbi:asparagine synthase (glutamine-hydrolyzing) [Amycolatopsis sp. WAC 01375]|uniref:asparagine synthase (glutamine-hydrolyzing) n=1 Tax=Amycolatopsis sp. WAC 01375 TaxID=2203194 RepID=UPI000F773C2C|nr:asparagine synthase (glutamine-hydrolyzing) [Amycolatopsis sp. WAC 01375]RSM73738.1 asparagine synthase (glutamine-hydrolyzing) [Amycolatopsis sp. WAC 01375]
MCGLLGLICSTEADAASARDAVDAAMRCQRHRGPDEHDTWADAEVVYGFNRLAFIDVDHAHQPLIWGPPEAPERYTLNFNGEIYNYKELRDELAAEHGAKFATEGDGEAIVAAYHYLGDDAVKKLRGMFAFMIWDSQEKVVFGARDPFGIKPLFYSAGPGKVAFSSEKKSLLELSSVLGVEEKLDKTALQHYLVLQYVPEPETLHAGIRRVESGTSFRLVPGGDIEFTRYFHPQFTAKPVNGQAEADALYERIADVMRDSVGKHMISDPDVTVGAFLSGGIDSTATATLAKEHNPNLIAFTSGFDRQGYSEVDVAAETAAAIGVKHVVRVVSAEEMMEAMPLIVWYLDDPVADPALVPLWFIAREARKHVKAVLSGEGADELFGGYTVYNEPISLAPFEKIPGGVRKILGKVSTKIPEGTRGKDLLRRGALPLEDRYYGNARNFRDEQLRKVLRTYQEGVGFKDVTAPWYRVSEGWDPVARMQHVDLFTWLRGDILVKADKVTMANSLELRVPFLDPEVFKVAATIPVDQKLTHGTSKYALRQALAKIIPGHVLNRRKLGFPVPIRLWLRDEMYDWAKGIISDSRTDALIDKKAALALLDEHKEGQHDRSRQLWALLMFMLWHGIFVENRIKPEVPEPVYPVKL